MKGKKERRHRHAFRFSVGPAEDSRTITVWAKVIPAKRDVFLPLKADHVRRSIKLRGVGNTQTCSMAVCALQEKDAFPHSVEGYIDWFYSRAFVVSRLDKNGMPRECYEYRHSDKIAQLNDTMGGQKKLLAQLEANGDRVIHLRPIKLGITHRGGETGKPVGIGNGKRTKVQPHGAKLRFAVAQMGGLPV